MPLDLRSLLQALQARFAQKKQEIAQQGVFTKPISEHQNALQQAMGFAGGGGSPAEAAGTPQSVNPVQQRLKAAMLRRRR